MPASGTRRASGHPVIHFTHVSNLPGILDAGCLQADSAVDRRTALRVEAADLGIKASRKQIPILVPPYGCVADYVPYTSRRPAAAGLVAFLLGYRTKLEAHDARFSQ